MTIRRPDHSRLTRVVEIRIADDAVAWSAMGFDVVDDPHGPLVRMGGPVLRLVGADHDVRGIVGWSIAGFGPEGATELDGLPTTFLPPASDPVDSTPPARHPNGITGLDHLVVVTPDLDRTVRAFESLGVPCRRIRDAGNPEHPRRQAFFRFGRVTIEIVSDDRGVGADPATAPAGWFGLAFDAVDLDLLHRVVGEDRCGAIHPAVQPGRRITTLRHRSFDSSVRLAALDDHPAPINRIPEEP